MLRFVRIIAKRTLRAFWTAHADSEQALLTWYRVARAARWESPRDVKARFADASIVANNRVVFNVRGNRYRLIVAFDYARQAGWIKFVGTHGDYDKIDATTVEMT